MIGFVFMSVFVNVPDYVKITHSSKFHKFFANENSTDQLCIAELYSNRLAE